LSIKYVPTWIILPSSSLIFSLALDVVRGNRVNVLVSQ